MSTPAESCPRCGKADVEPNKLTQKIIDWMNTAKYLGRITRETAEAIEEMAKELEER